MPTDTDATTVMQHEEAERAARAARIAAQNDAFRKAVIPCGPPCDLPGRVLVTRSVQARGDAFVRAALEAVAGDETFTPENDPYGDHGFGAVIVEATRVWWRIDLFDLDFRFDSEQPDDPDATTRVLTIMLPEDH